MAGQREVVRQYGQAHLAFGTIEASAGEALQVAMLFEVGEAQFDGLPSKLISVLASSVCMRALCDSMMFSCSLRRKLRPQRRCACGRIRREQRSQIQDLHHIDHLPRQVIGGQFLLQTKPIGVVVLIPWRIGKTDSRILAQPPPAAYHRRASLRWDAENRSTLLRSFPNARGSSQFTAMLRNTTKEYH